MRVASLVLSLALPAAGQAQPTPKPSRERPAAQQASKAPGKPDGVAQSDGVQAEDPNSGQPGTSKPGTSKPGTSQPGASQPGASQPSRGKSATGETVPKKAGEDPAPNDEWWGRAQTEANVAADELPPDAWPEGLLTLCAQLDQVLLDASEDLDLDVAHRARVTPAPVDDLALVNQASEGWALAAQLTLAASGADTASVREIPEVTEPSRAAPIDWSEAELRLRVVAVAPKQRVVLVRTETLQSGDLEVRALSMVRDLSRAAGYPAREPSGLPVDSEPDPIPSRGRAALAVSGALAGAYVGFAIENVGGGSDGALVYPLMTVGAGVGVGATMVVASEWDIGISEAWYLSAATWWPTVAAVLIADSTELSEPDDRYAYGLIGTTTGLALAATSLAFKHVKRGGAVTAHSGALLGMLYGGIGELMVEGDSEESPTLGMGVGMAAGVVAGGWLATELEDTTDSGVLFIDLGVVFGGLVGAAVASPVIVGDDVTSTDTRIWLGSVVAGTVAGGFGAAWLLEDPVGSTPASGRRQSGLQLRPYVSQVNFGQPGPMPWVAGVRSTFE